MDSLTTFTTFTAGGRTFGLQNKIPINNLRENGASSTSLTGPTLTTVIKFNGDTFSDNDLAEKKAYFSSCDDVWSEEFLQGTSAGSKQVQNAVFTS